MLGIMLDDVDMQGIMRMERRLKRESSAYNGEFLENNINGNGKYMWKGRVCVGEQKWHKSKMAC